MTAQKFYKIGKNEPSLIYFAFLIVNSVQNLTYFKPFETF